jgi:hypothetical protein
MNPVLPANHAAILARYQRSREVGRRLTTAISQTLDKEAIHRAGEALGILHKGTLYFDRDDVVCVLMDYAIQQLRWDGRNAIERYLSLQSPQADPEELQWLGESPPTRYTLYTTTRVSPGFGVTCSDLIYNDTMELIDIGFSHTAQPDVTFAGHVRPFEEFWITSGASLPVSPRVLKRLKPAMQSFRKAMRQPGPAAQEAEAEFAARVVRWCLEDGAAQRIVYQ